MRKFLNRLLKEEGGTTAVEYAVMLAMVIMLCVGSLIMFGRTSSSGWTNNANQLNSAMGGS